jgi:3-hydroxyisobutyrate dehydrogenase-like beta-hydroxyacid dehydrogenase
MAVDVSAAAAGSPVAVLGAGRMGGAMVGRLRGAGHPVTLWNRTPARAEAVASGTGAAVAATAREAAAAADIVLVSLADDAAVESAYAGPDGLIAGLSPGSVVVETSTVAPDTVRGLAGPVAARGAVLLDAPVSGSVPVVVRGELTFMVGGDPAALDRVRPVLDELSKQVFRLGDVGAGATMKLAVNSVVHALNQALSEALVLAERAGIDRAAAYEVFAASAVAAPYVLYKRAAFERPDETPVAFMLDLVVKDLELIGALAEQVDAPMPQRAANHRAARAAVEAGYGERDISSIAAHLRSPKD